MKFIMFFIITLLFVAPAQAFTVHFTNGAQLEVKKVEKIGNNYKLILPDGKEIYYGEEVISDYSVKDSDTGKSVYYGKEYSSGISIIDSKTGKKILIDDIQETFNKIKDSCPEKNDYETSSQFEERINNVSFYKASFVFLDKSILKWLKKYNAETGYLFIEPIDFLLDEKYMILDQKLESTSYLANNAFGASVSVDSFSGNEFGLNFNNASYIFTKIKKGYDIAIEPIKAKSLSENLGILFICKLRLDSNPENYWKEDWKIRVATFKSPLEERIRQHLINVELSSLYIFDKKTGVVYVEDHF